jgi:glycine oxidase
VERVDIVIAGGGIIGLSTALELVKAGLRVKVLEKGRAMAESSWAAAGMLAAEDPENPPELAQLAAFSKTLYPEYLEEIERLSRRKVPLRTRNALQATRPGGRFDCGESGTRFPVSRLEAEEWIPGLATEGRDFLLLDEWSLDPRDLCGALPLAAIAAGVSLEEETEVLTIDVEAASATIATSRGMVSAGAFVNCCGAWSPLIQEAPRSWSPEAVEPRKGQMAVVRATTGDALRCVLRTPDFYLVPRGDGRIVLGATVEQAGFDRHVHPAALAQLIAQAAELWPAIASAEVVESWAGFRPGTRDNLPLIGPSVGPSGAPFGGHLRGLTSPHRSWIATGHFRNGILLAPATGRVLRQWIDGEEPAVSLDAFAPERYSPDPAAWPR